MIVDFKCRETEKIWSGLRAGKLPASIQRRALVKLLQLDTAKTLEDLRMPPGNNLEALKGDKKGQHSIRINRQWRICFIWNGSDAKEIEIVDYH